MVYKRRKYNFNVRFFVFIFILFIMLISVLVLIFSPAKTTLQVQRVSSAGIQNGVLLFDEQMIDLPDYDDILYQSYDLMPLGSQETVATVYEPGYVVTAVKDLAELQKTIVTYQNNNTLKDIYKPELAQFDLDIEKAIKSLQNAEINSISFAVLNKNLITLMNQRQQYIRDNFTPDASLAQLYDDEASRTAALVGWQTQITASQDGYLSWYIDGYEEILKTADNKIESIHSRTVKDIIKAGEDGILQVEKKNQAKIIKKDHCYLAAVYGKDASYTIGQETDIYVSCVEEVYKATVHSVNTEDGTLVLFEINGDISKLISKRVVEFSTQPIYSGYVLPNQYIKASAGSTYIKTVLNGTKTQVDIHILAQDSDYTVFEAPQADQLTIGQFIYSK